jgi:hypothetical protein
MQSLRPTLESESARVGVSLELEVAPALPAVTGDRGRLQEALALMLADAVRRTPKGGKVGISIEVKGPSLSIVVRHGAPPALDVASAIAVRILEAHGALVEPTAGLLAITLPLARRVDIG